MYGYFYNNNLNWLLGVNMMLGALNNMFSPQRREVQSTSAYSPSVFSSRPQISQNSNLVGDTLINTPSTSIYSGYGNTPSLLDLCANSNQNQSSNLVGNILFTPNTTTPGYMMPSIPTNLDVTNPIMENPYVSNSYSPSLLDYFSTPNSQPQNSTPQSSQVGAPRQSNSIEVPWSSRASKPSSSLSVSQTAGTSNNQEVKAKPKEKTKTEEKSEEKPENVQTKSTKKKEKVKKTKIKQDVKVEQGSGIRHKGNKVYVGQDIVNRVKQIANTINCDWEDLMGLIFCESCFRTVPLKWNGKSAVGLIQFTDGCIKELNNLYGTHYTKQQIAKMTPLQQLDLAEKSLKRAKQIAGFPTSHRLTGGELFAMNLVPANARKNVVLVRGDMYYAGNYRLDEDGDGKVTQAELEQRIQNGKLQLVC